MANSRFTTHQCIALLCAAACGRSSPQNMLDAAPSSDATSESQRVDAGGPGTPKLVVIFGQSNAGDRADVSELIDPALADPYPAISYVAQLGTNNNPPIVNAYPLDALGPRDGRFGVEITMGRALDAAMPGPWVIAKFAYGSTALAGEWWPTGTWPPGEPNLFTQQITFVQAAQAATGARLAALVWIQGESDAVTVSLGQRYELELAEFIAAERLKLPASIHVPFVYGRLNIANPQVGAPYVRASQEANQAENAIMLDQDPYELGSDATHYTTQGVQDLGRAYAAAIVAYYRP